MTFDPTSRYYDIETVKLSVPTPDEDVPREIAYKLRRLIPRPEGQTVMAEHRVHDGDRLDNLTARYLGDPTRFWQICDANLALHPDTLTDATGNIILIAMPRV
jgi:hypothetical protein